MSRPSVLSLLGAGAAALAAVLPWGADTVPLAMRGLVAAIAVLCLLPGDRLQIIRDALVAAIAVNIGMVLALPGLAGQATWGFAALLAMVWFCAWDYVDRLVRLRPKPGPFATLVSLLIPSSSA